jgi:HK97 family phage portal protein
MLEKKRTGMARLLQWLSPTRGVDTQKALQHMTAPNADALLALFNQALYNYVGYGAPLYSDANTQNFIDKGYRMVADLYSVVSWIAQKGAKVGFEVHDSKGGVVDHEVLRILNNPNPEQGRVEFLEQFYSFYLTTGNAYTWMLPRTGARGVLEMHVLPSQWTAIVSDGPMRPVGGYTLTYSGERSLAPDQVIHVKTTNLDYGAGRELYGMSPIQSAWNIVEKAKSNQEAAKASFDNRGAAGLLYRKPPDTATMPMTQAQFDDLQKRAQDVMGGAKNRNKIIAQEGDFGYINFGLSPVDLNLLADAEASLLDICNIYHVPSQLFNVSAGQKYDNMQSAGRMAYTDAILPMVERFAQKFTRKVLQGVYGEDLTLVPITSDIPEMQGSKKEQAEWLRMADWLSVDEKRAEQDYEPTDGGDVVLVSSASVPLDLAGMDKAIPEA